MIEPPGIDRAVGMECYASNSPRCLARIKASPEDFVVEEAMGELRVEPARARGYVPLYRVEKRFIDTLHLERELGEALRSRVSTAGMKDKVAVAVQFATPTSSRAEAPETVVGEAFTATLVGFVPRPLSRGALVGNRFRIILRDTCADIEARVQEAFGLAASMNLPNFFGLQRFGGKGVLTHRVGKAMVLRRFQEAVDLLLLAPRDSDDQETTEAREAMRNGRFEEGSARLPPGQDVEKAVARRLAAKPGDYVGGLRAVPIRVRKLYTQAFQSYLFNRTLSAALKEGLQISRAEPGDNWGEVSHGGLVLSKVHGVKEPMTSDAVPLAQFAGFGYRNYLSRFDACAEAVMKEEGVSAREFYIKEMDEVSVEGGFRRPALVVGGPESEGGGDGIRLGFTLGRGSYATVLLREIVKPVDPAASGFA